MILYHGTIVDNIESIKQEGLKPTVGDYVQEIYGKGDEAVFAAPKHWVKSCLGAMTAHICYKLKKKLYELNIEDIKEHGAIAVIENGNYFKRIGLDDKYPPQISRFDYYLRESVKVDYFFIGEDLMSFLRSYGELDNFSKDLNEVKKAVVLPISQEAFTKYIRSYRGSFWRD